MSESADPGCTDWLHRDRDRAECWSFHSADQVVTSAHWLASQAGQEIFRAGGNAFDAAVATALALGACEPAASGLGGMAVAVIHEASSSRTFTVDAPCRAPALATPESVAGTHRYRGFRAVAVPTQVSMLEHLSERYGALPFGRCCEPAIRLAEEGYPISATQHGLLRRYRAVLKKRSAGPSFLTPDSRPRPAGEIFRQPELGRTLRRLASAGPRDFYEGELARRLDAVMAANGGFVRAGDLAALPRPRETEPLRAPFGDGIAHVAGPPAGGASLVQLLNMLSALPTGDLDPEDPGGLTLICEMIRRARDDRRRFAKKLGAEDIGGAGQLVDPEYAREVADELARACLAGETSHLCAVDASGNAISMTQSIERSFGSAELAGDLGFLLNGYLRGLKVRTPNHPHFLRPGAPARSNAAPTVALRDGRPWILVGSTGSERMISGIFTTLIRALRGDPFAAVHGPRLHSSPEGVVLWEEARFPAGCREALLAAGFELDDVGPYAFTMGGLQLIAGEPGAWVGVGEPRRDGAAAG